MKMTSKVTTKWGLVLLGIMLGIECLGSKRNPIDVQMDKVGMTVIGYMAQEGHFPASLDVLTKSMGKTAYTLLREEDLIDPWGEPFEYEYSGDKYVIWSSGPDKKMGTKDDSFYGDAALYVEIWRARQALSGDGPGADALRDAMPERVPSITKTVITREEQERQQEESFRKMEELRQALEEIDKARQVQRRNVMVGYAALLIGLCAVFYVIRKRKRLKKVKE